MWRPKAQPRTFLWRPKAHIMSDIEENIEANIEASKNIEKGPIEKEKNIYRSLFGRVLLQSVWGTRRGRGSRAYYPITYQQFLIESIPGSEKFPEPGFSGGLFPQNFHTFSDISREKHPKWSQPVLLPCSLMRRGALCYYIRDHFG